VTSILLPGELILDDDTPDVAHAIPEGFGTGFMGRGFEGYGDTAADFPPELLIPRSEWQARITEKEANGTQLSTLMIAAGLPCKNQQSTNYCWANAPTHCLEIIRVLQNEPMIILSPASVGGPSTNFRNVGGWGKTALQQIITDGAVPVDQWPANAIDKKYLTEANKTLALQYRVVDWINCIPRNLDQLISLLLRGIPVAIGLNWWGHEVTAYDALWLNGTIAVRFRNSWGMDWGHLGFATLQGQKMYPDDAVAPVSALAA